MARDGAESGDREWGTRGKSGRLPPQRLVHCLALEELGSDRGGRDGQKSFKTPHHNINQLILSFKEETTQSCSYK